MKHELTKVEYIYYTNQEIDSRIDSDENGIVISIPSYSEIYNVDGTPKNMDAYYSLESCIKIGYLIMGCILNANDIISFIDNTPNVIYLTSDDYIQYSEQISRDGDINIDEVMMCIAKSKLEVLENKNSLFVYFRWNEEKLNFDCCEFYYIYNYDIHRIKLSFQEVNDNYSCSDLHATLPKINFLSSISG